MKKLSREARAGIFALLMLLGLYWGISFIKGRDLLNTKSRYFATYDQVGGLQPSSSIFIKGFKVGTVSAISYDPLKSDKVVVELNIKRKFRIPDNSKARIYSDGLMGGKAVEIELGDSPVMLGNRDTLRSEVNKDFLEVAGSELDYLKRKASEVVDELTTTLTGVNELISRNSGNIEATISNLASITGSLDKVVASRRDDLSGIIENMNTLSRTLRDNSQRIDSIIANVDGFTDSLSRSDFPRMVENLSATLEQLDGVLGKVNRGDGSLGMLITDDSLYNNLNEASRNLSLLLEDVKESPGKYMRLSLFGGKTKTKTN